MSKGADNYNSAEKNILNTHINIHKLNKSVTYAYLYAQTVESRHRNIETAQQD